MENPRIDPVMFATAFAIVVCAAGPILLAPHQAGEIIIATYDWIANTLGLVYQWGVYGMMGFLGWLAFGPHGHRRLGKPGDRPDFPTRSWIAMLFCAGVGAALIYWATIEWTYYIDKPPFGAAPGSPEAFSWATSYGIFHWGPVAWAIYALPTVAIAWEYYTRGVPYLRLSTACHTLFGRRGEQSAPARALDSIFMLALLMGAGTSIGLSVPMISAALADAFGITRTLALDIGTVGCCVVLLALAAWAGLSKGIARVAELNVSVALGLLLLVLIAGPTLFILRTGTESIGFMLQNIVRMVTYTDPVGRTGFVEDWTIFYWAWWIAYGPFVGLFVARVSRGRTLRELILSMSVFGSLGSAAFFVVLGNYSLWLDMNGILPVREILHNQDPAEAISAVIGTLPLGRVAQFVFGAMAIVFIAATYNSKVYALAACTTRQLPAGQDPARWNRMFWAIGLGMLPIALMAVEGGIKVAKSAVLVASLPLLVVSLLMCMNLRKSLKEVEAEEASVA